MCNANKQQISCMSILKKSNKWELEPNLKCYLLDSMLESLDLLFSESRVSVVDLTSIVKAYTETRHGNYNQWWSPYNQNGKFVAFSTVGLALKPKIILLIVDKLM